MQGTGANNICLPHLSFVAYSLPNRYSELTWGGHNTIHQPDAPVTPAFPFPTSLQGHQVLLDPNVNLSTASIVSLLKNGHYSP